MGRPERHHGISTTAAGTLGSAELSIQQAIDSDRDGNDRQTLLLTDGSMVQNKN